jgi:hypothetical protein
VHYAGKGIQGRGHVLIYNIFLSSFIVFARALSVSKLLSEPANCHCDGRILHASGQLAKFSQGPVRVVASKIEPCGHGSVAMAFAERFPVLAIARLPSP